MSKTRIFETGETKALTMGIVTLHVIWNWLNSITIVPHRKYLIIHTLNTQIRFRQKEMKWRRSRTVPSALYCISEKKHQEHLDAILRLEVEIDLLKDKIDHIYKFPPHRCFYRLYWIEGTNTRQLIGPFINNPGNLKQPARKNSSQQKPTVIWEHTFTDEERSKK